MMFPVSVKSRLLGFELDQKTWYANPETKAKHVRDADYWGMPVGTLITPGMKPKRSRPGIPTPVESPKPQKAKSPKSSVGRRAEAADASLVSQSRTEHQPKSRLHPPFVAPEGITPNRAEIYRKRYESRTSIPPRNVGKYEGLTSAEMLDAWSPDTDRFYLKRGEKGNNKADAATFHAVISYTEDGYAEMNGLLRQDNMATAHFSPDEIRDTEKAIKSMDRAMRPVGRPLLVHRTTSAPIFANLQTGDQFRDNGYTSTTILEGYLSEVDADLYNDSAETRLEILVPPEAHGSYVTAFQDRKGESDVGEGELVLARGTEYRVVGRDGNNLTLEVVPPGSAGSTEYRDNLKYLAQVRYEELLAEEEGTDI